MEHEICIMYVEVCDAFRIKAEDWGSYEGKREFNLQGLPDEDYMWVVSYT